MAIDMPTTFVVDQGQRGNLALRRVTIAGFEVVKPDTNAAINSVSKRLQGGVSGADHGGETHQGLIHRDTKGRQLHLSDMGVFRECSFPPDRGGEVEQGNVASGEFNVFGEVVGAFGDAIERVFVVAIIFGRNGGFERNSQTAQRIFIAFKTPLNAFARHSRFGVLAVSAHRGENLVLVQPDASST